MTERPPAIWRDLRRFTPARVALGRAGNGMPTAAHLAFQADHAAARDAVHAELDVLALQGQLDAHGIGSRITRSACPDRRTFLLRPDLGRLLAPGEHESLAADPAPDKISLLVCDGLSAAAVHAHAVKLLARLLPALPDAGPVVIARQGRVALGDQVGVALGSAASVVLIGERPGLSSPDSLGIYLTWQPRPGRTDADRNCISNVREAGLPVERAAGKLLWLIGAMRRLRLSGVALKDEEPIGAQSGLFAHVAPGAVAAPREA